MSRASKPTGEGAFFVLEFKGDRLDPAPIISLLPLTVVRAVKKGDILGTAKGGKIPRAKTGYCGFTTADRGLPDSGNAHLQFLLEIVGKRIADIREVIRTYSLEWSAAFFDGLSEGQSFSDLKPELHRRSAQLGLQMLPTGQEAVAVVSDPNLDET